MHAWQTVASDGEVLAAFHSPVAVQQRGVGQLAGGLPLIMRRRSELTDTEPGSSHSVAV